MGILADTQQGIRKGTSSFSLLLLRLVSATVVGYTIALIGKGLMFYESLAFWFVFFVCVGLFMRATKKWAFVGVIVLDLVLFLIGLLLRMYVLVAPGA
tara:strand:+ start:5137 stop:5430 length:294 start_codon:yes stop_codon:yes gene_type:complete